MFRGMLQASSVGFSWIQSHRGMRSHQSACLRSRVLACLDWWQRSDCSMKACGASSDSKICFREVTRSENCRRWRQCEDNWMSDTELTSWALFYTLWTVKIRRWGRWGWKPVLRTTFSIVFYIIIMVVKLVYYKWVCYWYVKWVEWKLSHSAGPPWVDFYKYLHVNG